MNEEELTKVKILSHKISTPITTILGYISLINKKSLEGDVPVWANNIKEEALKISKYSKEINEIVSKNRP